MLLPRASQPLAASSPECQLKAGTHDGGAERVRKTPRSGSKGDQGSQAEGFSEEVETAAAQREGPGGGGGIAGAAKKVGGLLLGGRGRLTSAAQRRMAIELIVEANAAGARLVRACYELGISLRILSSRSPGRGSATTTPTRNHCSAQPSIVRITPHQRHRNVAPFIQAA